MMKCVRVAACCVAIVCAYAVSGAVTWPSDFWEKVSASTIKPSGSQIATKTAEIAVSPLVEDSAYCDSLGTAQAPFDSRYLTYGIATQGARFDSRPFPLIVTFR